MSITGVVGGSAGIGKEAAIRTVERSSGVIVTFNNNRGGPWRPSRVSNSPAVPL